MVKKVSGTDIDYVDGKITLENARNDQHCFCLLKATLQEKSVFVNYVALNGH